MKQKKREILCMWAVAILLMTAFVTANAQYDTKENAGQKNTNSLQPPSIEWYKTFGGSGYDMLYCVRQTDDGGYIAAGSTSDEDGTGHAWLVKIDANGNEEWSAKNLVNSGGAANIVTSYIELTDDGGYLVSGYNGVFGFMWKTDETGHTEWVKYYPPKSQGGDYGRLSMAQQTDDGGYVAICYKEVSSTDYDSMLIKTDSAGNVEWSKTYRYGNGLDELFSLAKTDDGGYVMGGYANTPDNVNYWVVKTDSQGNKQWEKTYGGVNWAASFARNACVQTDDGGYMVTGITDAYGAGKNDLWIVKTDENGNEEWNESFGESTDERCWSMDITDDGGYIFCLTKNYAGMSGSKGDVWIIKVDNEGNAVWSQTFDGSKEDRGYYISRTSDGGYIVAGRTESYGAGGSDGLLIKISPDEELSRPSIDVIKPKSGYIYLFDMLGIPFPFFEQALVLGDITFQVSTDSGAGNAEIAKVEYFINGVVVAEVTEQPFSYKWTGAEPGTYSIKVRVYNSWGGTDQETFAIKKVI